MSPSFPEHILDHIHDIAFAVFRVSSFIGNLKLKTSVENAAVELATDLDHAAVDKLAVLIRLAASIGEIKPVNAEVLERELHKLNEEIYRSMIGSREDIDLERFFAENTESGNKCGNESGNDAAIEKVSKTGNPVMDRQSSIVKFIRSLPDDCRMKDIIAAFPEVSERTLRNDIQVLISEGLVERFGNSGPNTYFKLLPAASRFSL